MKHIWYIFLVFVLLLSCYSHISEEKIIEKKRAIKRADFRTSLRYIAKNEGFYSFHRFDKGGETYMGIARNLNRDWSGWKIIDEYKKTHEMHWNDSIPSTLLRWKINDYYLSIWVLEDFFSIKDQDIANYLFDLRVNAVYGPLMIKKTLVEMNYPLIVNNRIDSTTIKYINIVPKWEFLVNLMNNRIDLYTRIVDKNPSQLVFYRHWISRVKV